MQSGIDPREILTRLVPGVVAVPTDLNDWAIWRLVSQPLTVQLIILRDSYPGVCL